MHHTECFQINILTLYNTASYNTGTWPVPYSATLHHTVHSHNGIITVAHCIIRPTATSAFSLSSIPRYTALPVSVTMHYITHGYISIITLWHNALCNTATPAWSLSCTLHHREYSYISIITVPQCIMQHTATSALLFCGTLHHTATATPVSIRLHKAAVLIHGKLTGPLQQL